MYLSPSWFWTSHETGVIHTTELKAFWGKKKKSIPKTVREPQGIVQHFKKIQKLTSYLLTKILSGGQKSFKFHSVSLHGDLFSGTQCFSTVVWSKPSFRCYFHTYRYSIVQNTKINVLNPKMFQFKIFLWDCCLEFENKDQSGSTCAPLTNLNKSQQQQNP